MWFDGTITSWNDDRGFGFIQPTRGGQDIFLHIKVFNASAGRPQVGQAVSFQVEQGPDGKKRAKHAAPARSAPSRAGSPQAARGRPDARRNTSAQWGTASLFAIPAFILVFLVVSWLWHPPFIIAGLYIAASAVTFITYAIDKSAARRQGWRTPEKTLHLLALVGGWPGALLAQQWLRHKSTKAEFRTVFWATVLVNVAAFVMLSSPVARGFLVGS